MQGTPVDTGENPRKPASTMKQRQRRDKDQSRTTNDDLTAPTLADQALISDPDRRLYHPLPRFSRTFWHFHASNGQSAMRAHKSDGAPRRLELALPCF